MTMTIFGTILLGLLSLLVFRDILESVFTYRAKKKEREQLAQFRLEQETSEALKQLDPPGKTPQNENQTHIIEEQKVIIRKLEQELKSKTITLPVSQTHVETSVTKKSPIPDYILEKPSAPIINTPDTTTMKTPEKTKPKPKPSPNRKTKPAKPAAKTQTIEKKKPKTKTVDEIKTERAVIIPLEPRDPHAKIVLPIGTVLTREHQRNIYTLTSVPGKLLKLAKNGTYVAVFTSMTKAAEHILQKKTNGPVWWKV